MRRALRVVALVAAVALSYVGGVVTGVVGSQGGHGSQQPQAGIIDEAADRIAAKAARPVDQEELERAAVEGMLRALGDRWSTYYGATEFASFQDALEGHYSGVGLWLRDTGQGVVISSVQARSPAWRAGMRAGDVVTRVGAVDVRIAGVGEVAALLRGEERSTVRVVVHRAQGVRTLRLTRASLTVHDVSVEHLRGGIVRVRIGAFTRGVGREVRAALRDSGDRHAGGVVLDLRDNPGGLLDEAVEVASVFLDGGPVVSYERRGRSVRTLKAFGGGDVATPLVVLVNSATASAAEVVAAALQDRNRAVVVGSRSYGKGSVQEPWRLSDGSALELTVGRYRTPDGRSLDGVGVEPDVVVPATEAPETAERRAVEVLTGLLAALGGTGRG